MLPTRSREIIISNMSKASSPILGILKFLYSKVDLGATGEGFTATCMEDEMTDLVQGFHEAATRIIEMLPVDMS
jgi:hypothetical protein